MRTCLVSMFAMALVLSAMAVPGCIENDDGTVPEQNDGADLPSINDNLINDSVDAQGETPANKTENQTDGANENPSVAIFYDIRYKAYQDSNDPLWMPQEEAKNITDWLIVLLEEKKVSASVVDADELRDYMKKNPEGIVAMTMGIAPDTIWNGSDDSFAERWLMNGGRMVWTGDWPFFDIGYNDTTSVHVGTNSSQYVFNFQPFTYTYDPYQLLFAWVGIESMKFSPTDDGRRIIPGISNFSVGYSRGVYVKTAQKESDYFLACAQGDKYMMSIEDPESLLQNLADPAIFAPKGGKGRFAVVGMYCRTDDPVVSGIGVEEVSLWMSEIISNEFMAV